MAATDLTKLIAQLEERRASVLADVRKRLHAEGSTEQLALANHLEDRGDWAAASADNLDDLALLQHEAETLARLDAALERARAGTLGSCRVCGEDIAPARLQAQPEAMTCLSCQQQLERRPGHQH